MHGALSALRPLILKRQAEAVQALKPQRTSASVHRCEHREVLSTAIYVSSCTDPE